MAKETILETRDLDAEIRLRETDPEFVAVQYDRIRDRFAGVAVQARILTRLSATTMDAYRRQSAAVREMMQAPKAPAPAQATAPAPKAKAVIA